MIWLAVELPDQPVLTHQTRTGQKRYQVTPPALALAVCGTSIAQPTASTTLANSTSNPQQTMPERNTGITAHNHIELRIGINLGDVIVEGDDLYGDGVNIAARIEALADAGGVFVSTVHDQVRDRLPLVFEDRGEQQVKNIARPVRVYRVSAAAIVDRAPGKTPPIGSLR